MLDELESIQRRHGRHEDVPANSAWTYISSCHPVPHVESGRCQGGSRGRHWGRYSGCNAETKGRIARCKSVAFIGKRRRGVGEISDSKFVERCLVCVCEETDAPALVRVQKSPPGAHNLTIASLEKHACFAVLDDHGQLHLFASSVVWTVDLRIRFWDVLEGGRGSIRIVCHILSCTAQDGGVGQRVKTYVRFVEEWLRRLAVVPFEFNVWAWYTVRGRIGPSIVNNVKLRRRSLKGSRLGDG